MKHNYEITIVFGKNHEMVHTLLNKTEDEAMEFASNIKAKYPDADVSVEKEK
jgi:hypothetical protein